MTDREYLNWVSEMCNTITSQKTIEVVFIKNGNVMFINTETGASYQYGMDKVNEAESLVLAYCDFIGLEVPEIENDVDETVSNPWRAYIGEDYFCIDGLLHILSSEEVNWVGDDDKYSVGNYFRTRERAEYIASKIEALLKIERMIDYYGLNLKSPEASDKAVIYYDVNDKHFKWTSADTEYNNLISAVVSSFEVATDICDILNKHVK